MGTGSSSGAGGGRGGGNGRWCCWRWRWLPSSSSSSNAIVFLLAKRGDGEEQTDPFPPTLICQKRATRTKRRIEKGKTWFPIDSSSSPSSAFHVDQLAKLFTKVKRFSIYNLSSGHGGRGVFFAVERISM